MERKFVLFAITVLTVQCCAFALTWRNPNHPDKNTIALFRFNEGEGFTSVNTEGNIIFNLNPEGADWTPNPEWMREPSGYALKGTGGKYAATTKNIMQTMDWSLPAITFSFWMRDQVQTQAVNELFCFGEDGWRNLQARIGYRPGWTHSYLMFAGQPLNSSNSRWPRDLVLDGEWHHIAIVGLRNVQAGTTNITVKLYIDNVQRNFEFDGEEYPEWTFENPKFNGPVTEFWYFLNNSGAEIDEFLIQAGEITDFSNGFNVAGGMLITVR